MFLCGLESVWRLRNEELQLRGEDAEGGDAT